MAEIRRRVVNGVVLERTSTSDSCIDHVVMRDDEWVQVLAVPGAMPDDEAFVWAENMWAEALQYRPDPDHLTTP